MKNKVAPTNNETALEHDLLLISKTDPKGIITYCNSNFIDVSGYPETELLGQQHNILRHPDMPRVIFKTMWKTLESNREFNCYIKNLTKNGDFYWVLTNVTPSFSSNNELLGYYSVRRKPDEEKLNYIKNLYVELLEIEQESTSKDAITKSQLKLDSVLNNREVGYDEFVFSI